MIIFLGFLGIFANFSIKKWSKLTENEIFEKNMAKKNEPKKFQSIFKFIFKLAEVYIKDQVKYNFRFRNPYT